MRNLLLTRGTEWQNVLNWRVLDMGEQPWNLLTAVKVVEYPKEMTAYNAARQALLDFPEAKLYMNMAEPDEPWGVGPQKVAQVMRPTTADLFNKKAFAVLRTDA